MRLSGFLIVILTTIGIYSCSPNNASGNESIGFNELKSTSANLVSLSLEYKQSTFNCTIQGDIISVERPLPFDADEVTVKSISISSDATSSLSIGSKITVSLNTQNIVVTAQDGQTKKTYALQFKVNDYSSIVAKHGLLKVNGNKIVDKSNQTISLAGNSFFWSNNNWGGYRYYKPSAVSWLKLDWNTTIVRAAMGVDESGGYLEDKQSNINRIKTIVDAAIDEGVYVIIDWHSHHAEDYPDEAVAFFEEMATLYGNYDNIIYEIYNEPLDISWDTVLKPYAETVIAAIRAIDPDNMIVVGTPEWSQRVDLAADNPITGHENIAYTLHFYSVHHKQWLRDRAKAALDKGIALFVTEWGVLGYTQDDPETEAWMQWCKDNDITHCSWAVNDKEEEWSIVKPGSNTNGFWKDSDLTDAGKLTRSINRSWQN